MATALTIATKFTAVDRFTSVVTKMGTATKGFANKASVAFARVERAGRKMVAGFKNTLGSFGLMLGAAALVQGFRSIIGVFSDFEQANAGLAAVMGRSVTQNKALADDAIRLGSITAKTATEVVGLQEAFARLGFTEDKILNMTQATINGAVAMRAELDDAAELMGAMVKTFDDLSSTDAPKIMDQMTMATQKSALNFEKLQTALPIVSGAANAAGVPFTKLMALLGKLSDAGIDASSSSTALRNIFLDSAKKGHSYKQILANIQKNQDKLTAANDEFGKRGAISAVILAKNMEGVNSLDKALQGASGTAEIAANKQLNTLNGRVTLLGSAWEGFILSIEKGDGKIGVFLKTVVEVVTEVLSLASGTAKTSKNLDDAGIKIRALAEKVMFFGNVLKWIVIGFTALKTVMVATRIATIAYNLVMGITGAITGSASIAIVANTTALTAYNVATKAVTAAQWLMNAAMYAIPIFLIIGGLVLIIKYWDEWGETVLGTITPLGGVSKALKGVQKDWSVLKTAFKEGGIKGVFKSIGQSILNGILTPIQHILELIAKIPGMAEKMKPALDKLQAFKNDMGIKDESEINKNKEPLNAEAAQVSITKTILDQHKSNATLNINDKSGMAEMVENNGMDIYLSNTVGT